MNIALSNKNDKVSLNKPAFTIAIAGTGTVGAEVINLLQSKLDFISLKCGRALIVTDISARDLKKSRSFDTKSLKIWPNAVEMAQQAEVDLIVELIGGTAGIALEVVETALNRHIPVVTANKALLAHHGARLAKIADQANIALGFEAAVAGGIPIVKAIKEGLVGNQITKVFGILNGTCNYILTSMHEARLTPVLAKSNQNDGNGDAFGKALSNAQEKGYAEADPTFDIEGVDTAHKLTLLSALAFGVNPDFDSVTIRGITQIESTDIAFAQELGYKIKLLGIAERLENGAILQQVMPVMVAISSPIAAVDGVYNGVVVQGDFVGTSLYEGRGAGGMATASAVVADIIDIAMNRTSSVFGIPADKLHNLNVPIAETIKASWYFRLKVIDKPGVVADISAILRDEGISIDSILQRGRAPMTEVNLVLITHESRNDKMEVAIAKINKLESVCKPAQLIQIMND